MKQRLLILLLLLCATTAAQTPDSCRPFVRWWWNGDKVDTLELKRELHLLHEAGIGGVEINPIEFPSKRCDSLGIPSLTWLGDEWIAALGSTLREAKRLGMQCDLLVGSGWPFGMETLPMEYRAQVMLTYAIPVDLSDGKPFTITRQQIFDAVNPKVTEPNPDRQFELVDLFIVPDSITDIRQMIKLVMPGKMDSVTMKIENSKLIIANYPDAETNSQLSILNSQFSTLNSQLSILNSQLSTPNSQFSILNSQFYMYALVRCTSFASVINGAPGASGPILDHMNRQAVRHFLYNMSHTLEGKLGPMKNWLRAYFADSMELEGANWTTDFAEEFRRRRGYDLMPWLPFTMFKTGRLGDVVSYEYGAKQSPDFSHQVQKVRHDFELTKAELLHERYTETFLDWCHSQGVKARAQAYGRGFFPLESSLGYDIPEGESWTTNYLRHRIGEEMPDSDYRRGRAYTMINKLVSSAAHQRGRRLVSAEEMTNTYRMFETTLELLKLGSDMSAISGITHSVWHGFNYSPPQAGFPGWVQYGSYLNEQNTWWPYFHLLNEYRSRMSAILQNADMQTDIAILLPVDSLWAQYGVQTEPFPNYPKGSPYDIPFLLWEAVHKNGGNCDFVTPRQLDTATVRDGRLIVGKRAYSTLLVPPPITWDPSFSIFHFPFSILEVPDLPDRNYLEWYRTAQSEYKLPHAVAIEEPNRYLLQNHYRNDRGDDIFLFVNACLRSAVGSTILFPKEIYQHRTACVYNAATDEKQLLELDDGAAWLYLPPAESLFILFESTDTLTHSSTDTFTPSYWSPAYHEGQHYFPLHTEWHLSLHHAIEGWTRDTVMQQLCDLRETPFKDFSGTLTYTAHLPLDSIGPNPIFDLGQVYDICELIVNGTSCGVKWYGERIYYNAAPLLHPGLNTIQVRVTTTLNNYVHTLTDDKVIQHYILKRNVPTTPAGLLGIDGQIAVF